MKPCQQLFALVLEKLPEYMEREEDFNNKIDIIKEKYGDDETKYLKKVEELRAKEIKEIIFDTFLPKKIKGKKVKANPTPDFYI